MATSEGYIEKEFKKEILYVRESIDDLKRSLNRFIEDNEKDHNIIKDILSTHNTDIALMKQNNQVTKEFLDEFKIEMKEFTIEAIKKFDTFNDQLSDSNNAISEVYRYNNKILMWVTGTVLIGIVGIFLSIWLK